MSGHSKFANIKHKKERNDAAKGKIFTRLGREIMVATKQGGADPSTNSRLREVIAKAKSNNMPNDNIDRNIKKAAGELGSAEYENITYEGYGPNGVAVIVEVLTDNRNRAAANVRNAFTKGGGNMGTSGCVSFLFDNKGIILVEKTDKIDEENLMNLVLENDATDFVTSEEGYEISCNPYDFGTLREVLESSKIEMASSEVGMFPQNYVTLESSEDLKKMNKLLTLLDEEDDVQNVWHNWDE